MTYDKILAERKGKVVYKIGDSVVKLFESEFHPKSDVLNEALNQARVEETGLPIPNLTAVSIIDGKWAITIDYVEGKTLQELMNENPDKIDEYLNMFVDLQLEVHSKRAPLLNKLKDKMNRKISSLQDVDATTRYELHTRLESMPNSIFRWVLGLKKSEPLTKVPRGMTTTPPPSEAQRSMTACSRSVCTSLL